MENQQRKAARATRGTRRYRRRDHWDVPWAFLCALVCRREKRVARRARRRFDVLTVRADVIEYCEERAAEQAEIEAKARAFTEEMTASLDYLQREEEAFYRERLRKTTEDALLFDLDEEFRRECDRGLDDDLPPVKSAFWDNLDY